jgi:dTDP-4-dehydrorhamnose 3,5-epimerase
MDIRELSIPGAWEITPRQFPDDRGVFLEYFKDEAFVQAVGHRLDLAQANCSVSAAGVLRGLHFADVPPGQAKYVTCARGAVLDVAVDLRVGSPTFGRWDSVLLDDVDRRAIYLSEGLGHAFMSLEDDSTVLYLCSTGYAPGREHGVHPLDPTIGIDWPTMARDGSPLTPRLSEKDLAAPTLVEAQAQGLLPTLADVQAHIASLSAR